MVSDAAIEALAQNGLGLVRRAIVNDDDFGRATLGGPNASDRLPEEVPLVEARDDDGN